MVLRIKNKCLINLDIFEQNVRSKNAAWSNCLARIVLTSGKETFYSSFVESKKLDNLIFKIKKVSIKK